MYPQSKPATAADALRNPQRRPVQQVRRQGSVGMGGGMGGGVKPMGGSPYPPAPPAPRPMQPQRPQVAPMPTANSSFDPSGRPIAPRPVTAIDALKGQADFNLKSVSPNLGISDKPMSGIDLNRISAERDMVLRSISNATGADIQQMMMDVQRRLLAGDPNAEMYMQELIKRRSMLGGIQVTPQPYTPNPNLTNQSQSQY